MTIFVSWSGARGKIVGEVFGSFLRDVLSTDKVFFSDLSIPMGAAWFSELSNGLSDAKFCIVIATKEALVSPWVMYEAGAVWARTEETRLSAIRIGLSQEKLDRSPLSQFQNCSTERKDVLQLVQNCNASLSEPRPSDIIEKHFERSWPNLQSKFQEADEPEEISQIEQDQKQTELLEVLLRIDELEKHLINRQNMLEKNVLSNTKVSEHISAGFSGQNALATASPDEAVRFISKARPNALSALSNALMPADPKALLSCCRSVGRRVKLP